MILSCPVVSWGFHDKGSLLWTHGNRQHKCALFSVIFFPQKSSLAKVPRNGRTQAHASPPDLDEHKIAGRHVMQAIMCQKLGM